MASVLESIISTTVEKLGPSDKLGSLMKTSKLLPAEFKTDLAAKLKESDSNDNAVNWYQVGSVMYSVKTERKLMFFVHECHCTVTKYEMHLPQK
jgi:hypothetical protein